MIQNVLAFAAQKTGEGEKVALITVTATSGSSPASAGQVMAVLTDGTTAGTVGGGASEYRLIKQAVQAIKDGTGVFEFSFNHTDEGMACGGSLSGIGNVLGSQANIAVFGGGHVAQSFAKVAALTGFNVRIIEDREEFANYFEDASYIVCTPDKYEEVGALAGCDYAVICTRGHYTDTDALRYCLTKPLKYLGMIGSARKTAAVLEILREEGVSDEVRERVFAPIGLDVASGAPAEIAISIMAEILLVKNGGKPAHKRADI
ncbi:MAG: XdhC/CoxI family protein [Oscillospiraceae bacterium]|nr:XdhC/CoxI family protein [Oscillospiraceae bacterium]